MTDAAIRAEAVTKAFGGSRAVDRADLDVRAGEVVALLGPSGSGKTTLLRLLAGFEVPDEGTVRVRGRTVAGGGVFEEPDRRRIGMVFQDGALFPHLTVGRNVEFGRPRPGRGEECLEMVGLAHRASSYPHELSGGERQRIALARALAVDPEVVLLDEPFAALDENLRAGLREEVLRVLRAAGASALIVTHNQQEALSMADTVALMRAGRIEQVGSPETLYEQPATRWVAEFLGDADTVTGSADGGVVDSELGRFPADRTLRGAVEVLVRPERVTISRNGDGVSGVSGVSAVVARRTYFGADQVVTLELPTGTRVRCRAPGGGRWTVGERVRVAVTGDVVVLPAAAQALAEPERLAGSPT
ncbi:ABC transporter ATP-binding protein [Pseudonocardia sp.]|uniref:ABC transporter ATP-binding protein n=1 Tax=Pseudonocardia sp. TaxID=60912 RepID=UPI003D0C9C85